ncbi:hypothetical protein ZWY2020_025700 [Hordeum vulgare]|nr:hypothetical protein ZWY2020_025700 [Hordeum vulgare]
MELKELPSGTLDASPPFGVIPADVRIHVEDDNVLVITSDQKQPGAAEATEKFKPIWYEQPESTDLDNIHAEYKTDVLTVTMEKLPLPGTKSRAWPR